MKKVVIAAACRLLRPYEVLKLRGAARRAGRELKVQLGSGSRNVPGWVNIDYNFRTKPDVTLDLTRRIPLDDGCVRFIYSEDFLEHIPFAAGQALMAECHRLLASGGVLRILTPDLGLVVKQYVARDAEAIEWYSNNFNTTTAGQMLNAAMREMEHCFLYDEETLVFALKEAGFGDVQRKSFCESEHAQLCGLDQRKGSLILEAARGL